MKLRDYIEELAVCLVMFSCIKSMKRGDSIIEEPEQLKAKKALHIECHAVAYAEFRA